ncbi:alpha/beta hydrolase family protein [Paenibacillus monticola]|uniref:Prolyl oligopeptidase family serine peptidase n=1 Tax=Paenibacillus monticola TaxID=2666075 RepID=A0A7X2HBE0_9BACL|nr:S9 family peptidase [Paenibacillus monticola]MRN56900.1 prolyl oligopeptidase family serine peptidase [Paenibacillus monticola]
MGKRPIEPEVLLEYQWVSDPAVHPLTSAVAYMVKEIDPVKNNYRTHIRVVSIEGEDDTPLTDGDKDSSPLWSPDGKQLAFLRIKEDGKQVWTVSADATRITQLTYAKRSVGNFVWSPDGKMILYSSKVSNDMNLESLSLEEARKDEGSRGKMYNRTLPKAEGAGWWDGMYTHLFLLYLESGAITQLTSGNYNASQPAWSPDGQEIAFLAKIISDAVNDPDLVPYNDVYTMNLTDMKLKKRTISTININQFNYSPDGTSFAIIGDDRKYGSGTQNRLYTVSTSGGTIEVFPAEIDMQIGNYILNDVKSGMAAPGPLFVPNGTEIYSLGTSHGQVHLYRFAKNVAPEAVTKGDIDIYQLTTTAEGTFVVGTAMDAQGPAEIVRIDTQTGRVLRLTNGNKKLMDDLNLSVPEELWVDVPDGYPLQGWIMKPPGLSVGQKVPLALVIHGGPHAMYSPTYSHELQTLAAEGYAVLFANPRGSFGYGQDFAQGCRGDFGGGDYEDLMAMVDTALARYDYIDDTRLGVIGGSYGGLMTNWIVTQTKRFRAAVSQRSISNWLSFYGLSDIGISYTEGIVGGNPWDQPELLWQRSPLAHVKKVEVPMLIMHGEQDLRCPIGQSDEWYTALKRLGKKARLIRYPGSNHSFLKIGKPSYRVEALEEVNSWFNEHLRGGE